MFAWLMAKYYDYMLRDAEEKCLQDWRKTLLQDLSGDVIELGCGTGANLAFYPQTINRLVLTEPNPHMRSQLSVKLIDYTHLSASTLDCSAELIPFPDASFDVVVSTLLLCSVKNPQQALSEIHRVLRPHGKLLFIEHVAASNNPVRLKWQRCIEPVWKMFQCGCHLTRDTEKNILQAGFTLQKITRQSMRGVPAIARPAIWGEAVKI
jgi:ubiquinone/menaquinone biosynthesis C-methylase UbiE